VIVTVVPSAIFLHQPLGRARARPSGCHDTARGNPPGSLHRLTQASPGLWTSLGDGLVGLDPAAARTGSALVGTTGQERTAPARTHGHAFHHRVRANRAGHEHQSKL